MSTDNWQGQRMTGAMFDEMQQSSDPATDPHLFMTANNIDQNDFRAALVEYRDLDTGWPGSPWASDEIGVLAADFINWYQWERL